MRVTRGGREGEGEVSGKLETGKKCPNFGEKCPDCSHLWFKFLNFKVYRRKNRGFFPVWPFFFVL